MMNFEEIKKQAISKWNTLQNSPKPRILIGMGTCGIAAGAEDILKTLREELDKNGLQADIIQVGCIGFCYAEPLVEIAKPGKPAIFYGNLTPALVKEIVRDYLVGNNPRPELALGTRGEGTIAGIVGEVPDALDSHMHSCRLVGWTIYT
jgi:NADH-quinone oxidoreductase subunit F